MDIFFYVAATHCHYFNNYGHLGQECNPFVAFSNLITVGYLRGVLSTECSIYSCFGSNYLCRSHYGSIHFCNHDAEYRARKKAGKTLAQSAHVDHSIHIGGHFVCRFDTGTAKHANRRCWYPNNPTKTSGNIVVFHLFAGG